MVELVNECKIQAKKEGYTEGMEFSETDAWEKGYEEGFKEGLEKGNNKGIAEGFKIAKSWEAQAMQMGLSRGLTKGLEQGEKGMLLILLKEKFGKLPSNELKKLGALNNRQVEKLAIKLLTSHSLEELLMDIEI